MLCWLRLGRAHVVIDWDYGEYSSVNFSIVSLSCLENGYCMHGCDVTTAGFFFIFLYIRLLFDGYVPY